jgi:DNA-binding MarR family transcriptional regulator
MKHESDAVTGEDALPREALEAANSLRRSVSQIMRRLRSLRPDRSIAGSKLSLLSLLHRRSAPMIAADIARVEHLQPQSLTRIIQELDDLGLVRRRPDDADHRQILIEITPRGVRHLVRNAVHQNVWLAQAMATKLTPAERDILRVAAGLLDRLVDEMPSG